MSLGEVLPVVNASMNGIAFCALISGWLAVRAKKVALHKTMMLTAVTVSALFLVGYVTRIILTGTHTFPDVGVARTIYLSVLISHSILAVLNLPLIIWALVLAFKKRFETHRKVVKIAWPVWIYVSFTGVVVYVMLYHVAPALA
jgi:putative membrane protein